MANSSTNWDPVNIESDDDGGGKDENKGQVLPSKPVRKSGTIEDIAASFDKDYETYGSNEAEFETSADTEAPRGNESRVGQSASEGDERDDAGGADQVRSRAERRIKSVIGKLKDKTQEAEEARKEAEELRAQLALAQKGRASASKSAASKELESLKTHLRKAREEGDVDKEFDLISKIGQTQVALMAAAAVEAESDYRTVKQQEPATGSQTRPEIPPAARNWIKRNPSFHEDRKFNRMSIALSDEIVEEMGYDYGDEDLYAELDRRLTAIGYKTASDAKPNSSGGPPRGSKTPDPSSAVRTPDGKLRVVITKEDEEFAKQFGVDPKKFALEKAKMAKNNFDTKVWQEV